MIVLLGTGAGRSRYHCAPAALVVMGRVSLFFYVLHIDLLHGMAVLCGDAPGPGDGMHPDLQPACIG